MSTINIQLKIQVTLKLNNSSTGVAIKTTVANTSMITALELTTPSSTPIIEMNKELVAFIKREMNQRLLNNLTSTLESAHHVNANIQTNVTKIIYKNNPLTISEKSVGSVMKDGDVFQVIGTVHQSSSPQVILVCCTIA